MKIILAGLRYLKHFLFSGFYHLGWMVVFGEKVRILNAGSISLGDRVNLYSYSSLGAFDGYQNQVYKYKKPKIKIENNVGIGMGTLVYALRSIHIKRNTMVGPYCFIGDYDHQYKDVGRPIVDQPLANIESVVIEEGAWIGAHVTISSGVRIGKNSVVGANSVVTKDIPDYSVAVGVPARVIKRYDHKSKTWKQVSMKRL